MKRLLARLPRVRLPKIPVVEVNVSEFCEHGCFVIWMGSPSVWRITGEALEAAPEDGVRFHVIGCSENDECSTECWGED